MSEAFARDCSTEVVYFSTLIENIRKLLRIAPGVFSTNGVSMRQNTRLRQIAASTALVLSGIVTARQGRGLMRLPGWLGIGLFSLGLTIGLIVGLSQATGISTTLVTTIFTFVGGTVLTFSGFRRSADKESPIDSRLAGAGLTALMLGSLSGLAGGLYLHTHVCVRNPCDGTKPVDEKVMIHLNASGENDDLCTGLKKAFQDHRFDGQEGPPLAVQQLKNVADHCVPQK